LLRFGRHQTNRLPHQILQVRRLPFQNQRTGKLNELADDAVQSFGLGDHDFGRLFVFPIPGQPFFEINGKSLDGAQRIADFVRHAGGQRCDGIQVAASGDFLFHLPDTRHVAGQQNSPFLILIVGKSRRNNLPGLFAGFGSPKDVLFNRTGPSLNDFQQPQKRFGQNTGSLPAHRFRGRAGKQAFCLVIAGGNFSFPVHRQKRDGHILDQGFRKDGDPRKRHARQTIRLDQKKRHDGQRPDQDKHERRHCRPKRVFPGRFFDFRHIESDINNQALFPGIPRRRGKPPVNLKRTRTLGIGRLPPENFPALRNFFHVQIKSVGQSQHGRITVRQNMTFAVRDHQVIHVRLLGRFHEQFLKIEDFFHLLRKEAQARFKRMNQRCPLLDQQNPRLILGLLKLHQQHHPQNDG